jgi:hypothetical protein
MRKPLYKMIEFPSFSDKRGVLSMFQTDKVKGRTSRGAHAHFKTTQVLIALEGGCTVDLDDGRRKKSVVLKSPGQGLLLYPYVWHVMRDFRPHTVLLALADSKYDEKDYIRDHDDFIRYAKKRPR